MPELFNCPYCKHKTADPVEGYLENEDDPDTEETRWYCSTCHAEWWAYGREEPEREKVLMISPRYPVDKIRVQAIETCAARYLFRRQLFYRVQHHVDLHNHGEAQPEKPVSEIIASIKDFGVMGIWAIPVYVRLGYID